MNANADSSSQVILPKVTQYTTQTSISKLWTWLVVLAGVNCGQGRSSYARVVSVLNSRPILPNVTAASLMQKHPLLSPLFFCSDGRKEVCFWKDSELINCSPASPTPNSKIATSFPDHNLYSFLSKSQFLSCMQ